MSPGWKSTRPFSGNRTVSPQKERQGTGRGANHHRYPADHQRNIKNSPVLCRFDTFRGCSCSHSQTFSAVIFSGRSGVRPAPVRGKPGIHQVPSAILPILIYRDSLHQGMTSGNPGTGMPQETLPGTGRAAFYSIFSSCGPACIM